jgi:putative ubiquitin-RnfH superfamily antitoxin RatB of RatAB toxin-antitoxin module
VKVLVVLALADRQWMETLELPPGATVGDAIAASGLAERFPGEDLGAMGVGVWNHACERGATLRDGDRVELYRPIHADARAMRRARAAAKPSKPTRSGR